MTPLLLFFGVAPVRQSRLIYGSQSLPSSSGQECTMPPGMWIGRLHAVFGVAVCPLLCWWWRFGGMS